MTFNATVYRVLIASPGDLHEERDVIEEAIHAWNAAHAAVEGIVLLPVRWESHSVPEFGDRPQAILNRRLVADCDLLIGAFWTRVGTATGGFESGTVEEIEQFTKAGKPALLYFSSRPIDPDRVELDQLKRVRELRLGMEGQALIGSFLSPAELGSKLTWHLLQQIRRLNRASVEASSTMETSSSRPTAEPITASPERPEETLDRFYLAYWTAFSDVFRESGVRLRAPTPAPRNYVTLSLKSSDMWLNAFASVRDRFIGVDLILGLPRTHSFELLYAERSQIERELGYELEWNVRQASRRIILSDRGFDPTRREDWARQHKWLIEKLQAFQSTLVNRIDA